MFYIQNIWHLEREIWAIASIDRHIQEYVSNHNKFQKASKSEEISKYLCSYSKHLHFGRMHSPYVLYGKQLHFFLKYIAKSIKGKLKYTRLVDIEVRTVKYIKNMYVLTPILSK